MREFMKKWKIGLWLVSFTAAILLWLYITAYINPEETLQFSGIKPVISGTDVLTERNLVLLNYDDLTMDIKVSGNRMDIIKLKPEQIEVKLDLSDINQTISESHAYTVSLPSNITLVEQQPPALPVVIDNLATESVEVNLRINGVIADGYIAGKESLEPSSVKITGPETVVSKVASASVVLNREQIDSTVTDMLPFTLRDKDANEIPRDMLTFDVEQIKTTIPINIVKDVHLSVDVIAGGGATEKNIDYTIDPPSIKIEGDPDLLESYNQITVGMLDLSRIVTSSDLTFPILIPNNAKNLSGQREATVSVHIKGLETKTFEINAIEAIHPPEGRTVNILTQNLTVQIRGPAQTLEKISAHNIRAVADLAGLDLPIGQRNVDVNILIDGYADAGAVGPGYSIAVDVTEAPSAGG